MLVTWCCWKSLIDNKIFQPIWLDPSLRKSNPHSFPMLLHDLSYIKAIPAHYRKLSASTQFFIKTPNFQRLQIHHHLPSHFLMIFSKTKLKAFTPNLHNLMNCLSSHKTPHFQRLQIHHHLPSHFLMNFSKTKLKAFAPNLHYLVNCLSSHRSWD